MIKTTGNRSYGNAPVGRRAVEIQRYAANATFTVNLLHSILGIDLVNILPGPSNGLELLNFFAEALQEQDIFGNPLLKQGDLVIMDNCGFHHAHHVEPVLRNMLGLRGVCLVFQPPYHPVYNTCEHCFRFRKSWLRKNSELAEHHTEVAIYDALSRITPQGPEERSSSRTFSFPCERQPTYYAANLRYSRYLYFYRWSNYCGLLGLLRSTYTK